MGKTFINRHKIICNDFLRIKAIISRSLPKLENKISRLSFFETFRYDYVHNKRDVKLKVATKQRYYTLLQF